MAILDDVAVELKMNIEAALRSHVTPPVAVENDEEVSIAMSAANEIAYNSDMEETFLYSYIVHFCLHVKKERRFQWHHRRCLVSRVCGSFSRHYRGEYFGVVQGFGLGLGNSMGCHNCNIYFCYFTPIPKI